MESQEFELLKLCCARTRAHSENTGLLRPLCAPLDWTEFLRLVQRNEVAGLVFDALAQTGSRAIPRPVMGELQRKAHLVASTNLRLAGHLLQAWALLSGCGISVLPMKGAAIAAQLYGRLGLRHFGDIDLLIRPEQSEFARRELLRAGYHALESNDEFKSRCFSKRHKHFSVTTPDGASVIELHWNVLEPGYRFRLSVPEIFERAVTHEVLGERLPMMCREHSLLMLSAHGCHHGWDSLKWICDIDALCRSMTPAELCGCVERAKSLGCYRMVLLALTLSHNFLATPLPPELSQAAVHPGYLRLSAITGRKLVSNEEPYRPGTLSAVLGDLAHLAFTIECREHLVDRAHLIFDRLAALFQPNHNDLALNKVLLLQYLLRPLRLIRLYGIRCIRPLVTAILKVMAVAPQGE